MIGGKKVDTHKLPEHLENPIDNQIRKLTDICIPHFHKHGITPNMLTTVSLVSGLFGAYMILHHHFIIAGLLYIFAYIFDCFDGATARRYHMHTAFGDYYDHISDVVKEILTLVALCMVHYQLFVLLLPIIILTLYGCAHVFNSQEKYLGSSGNLFVSPSLYIVKYVVQNGNTTKHDSEKMLRRWRWVGCGTKYSLLACIIFAYGYVDSRPDIRKRINKWFEENITIKLKRIVKSVF
jgi:phosphatidylglycerophosphate synthase